MDYRCVVIYTVINISPARLTAQALDNNEGSLDRVKKKIIRAVAVYFKSLQFTPHQGAIYENLAYLYYNQGLIDLAIKTYKRAVEINPDLPDAYCNLGNALKEKGLESEAEDYYNKALQFCPRHVDALNNLGNVRREQGRIEEAYKLYSQALLLDPNYAATQTNLASLLQQQGRYDEALSYYIQTIKANPQFTDAYNNMGIMLMEMQDFENAKISFQKAIEIKPNFADAHSNLGSIYKEAGKINEAIESFKNALRINPNLQDAYCSLTHCLQIVCSWDDYEKRMKNIILIVEQQLKGPYLVSVHPHHSILYPLSNHVRRKIAERYASSYTVNVGMFYERLYPQNKLNGERLRIGYVSSDFGNHPTSHLMQSIPGLHDRNKLEIFCYALNPDDGSTFRRKIIAETEHFIDLSAFKCNKEAAKKICSDKIHILVNMNGYTKGSRNELFAMKSAPIQVMWLGYPGTSGANYMDYIITDEVSSPISAVEDFSEKFAYMPYTYFIGDHKNMFPHLKTRYDINTCDINGKSAVAIINVANKINIDKYFKVKRAIKLVSYKNLKPLLVIKNEIDIPRNIINDISDSLQKQISVNGVTITNGKLINQIDVKIGSGEILFDNIVFTSRQQYELPDDAVVFCNFNQLYKIDPMVLNIWVKILKKVANSVLWLVSFPALGKSNLLKYADNLGLSRNRIIFSKVACKEEHVRRGQLADICLDTPLCNGHTTTMDMIWSGTPVVTLPGKTLASRVAASQLIALKCSELVAKSAKEYENIAVKFGLDAEYRTYIRAKVSLLRFESTLFNCEYYSKSLEALYKEMWNKYENGKMPDHIRNIS